MNTDYSFSRRQLLALCMVFVLSPALRLVPPTATRLAGRAAWLSPVLAAPFVMLYAVFLSALFSRRAYGEGMGQLALRALGGRWGKVMLGVLAAWFLLYAAFTMRSGSERIISTMYPDSGPEIFIITMTATCLIAALDAPRTLVRAANIFLAAVLGVLLVVLIFALFSVRRENLLPVSVLDLPGALGAAGYTVNVSVLPLYAAAFLTPLRHREEKGVKSEIKWVLGVTLLLVWLMVGIVGCFGAELAAHLTHPFFTLVKNLRFFNTVERVEALVVSLWFFTDFVVVSVCIIAAQLCLRLIMGKSAAYVGEPLSSLRRGRWVIRLCAVFCAVLAFLLAPDPSSLDKWSRIVIPATNCAVAFILLPIIYIVGRIRKTL